MNLDLVSPVGLAVEYTDCIHAGVCVGGVKLPLNECPGYYSKPPGGEVPVQET